MPLYELASDRGVDAWLRRIARRALEELGFERVDRDDGPSSIFAWVGGVVAIGGSLVLASIIGPVAIIGLLAGAALIVAYYARESRRDPGGWYAGPGGDGFWIPGDSLGDGGGGWLGDFFGGGDGGGGGGGNGGGA